MHYHSLLIPEQVEDLQFPSLHVFFVLSKNAMAKFLHTLHEVVMVNFNVALRLMMDILICVNMSENLINTTQVCILLVFTSAMRACVRA